MGDHKYENICLSTEQKEELSRIFKTIETSGSGYILIKDLGDALNAVAIKIPPYEVRKMISEWEHTTKKSPLDGKLQFCEFEKWYKDLKSKEFATTFKSMVSRKDNLVTHGGMSETSSAGTTHTVRQEEQVAFSHWVNTNLGHDKDLLHLLPIDQEGMDLYDKVKDGILLCKVINFSCPDTIDERALNTRNLNVYTRHENLVLAINSAMAIGCNVVNIGADDLTKGKPHLVLGLLWQIIRIGLFNQVDLQHCPGLVKLLKDGEKLEDMMKLSTEAILLRWVNYHLNNAGYVKQITNFTTDIMDSLPYIYLIHEIAPKDCGTSIYPSKEFDLERRAEFMLREADKIRCRAFLSPRDVVNGNYKLNVAFVANMFNMHPCLIIEANDAADIMDDSSVLVEETREERTYRNWMNSMGVTPHVNWLYSDLCDGIVIFQLYDIIKPGLVEWIKVHKQFSRLKAFMEKIENCNYAVVLGKELKFSLVGIAGQDINDGNSTLTLALVWQLMRAYTLSMLCNLANCNTGTPMGEREIIKWVNDKLKSCGKETKLNSFQDSTISDGKVVLDLVDSIKRGSVDYAQIKDGSNKESKLENAKYAISMSRKLGAKIYALPEDIVEVKPKMVMTVFACLMGRDYKILATTSLISAEQQSINRDNEGNNENLATDTNDEITPYYGILNNTLSLPREPLPNLVWCSPRSYNNAHNNQHVIFTSSDHAPNYNGPLSSNVGHKGTCSRSTTPRLATTSPSLLNTFIPDTTLSAPPFPLKIVKSNQSSPIRSIRSHSCSTTPPLGPLAQETGKIGNDCSNYVASNMSASNIYEGISSEIDITNLNESKSFLGADFITINGHGDGSTDKLINDEIVAFNNSLFINSSKNELNGNIRSKQNASNISTPSVDFTSWIKSCKKSTQNVILPSLSTPNYSNQNIGDKSQANFDIDGDNNNKMTKVVLVKKNDCNGHPSPILTNKSFVN